MSEFAIHARLSIELCVSTYDDGVKTAADAKAALCDMLELVAERLRSSNEDNILRSLVDDRDGRKCGSINLAISELGGAL